VHFTKSKKDIVWEEGLRSILELAESAGLRPDLGCQVKFGGGCEVRLRKGKGRSRSERNKNSDDVVKICGAVPTTSIAELNY
jgi:ferredoxin